MEKKSDVAPHELATSTDFVQFLGYMVRKCCQSLKFDVIDVISKEKRVVISLSLSSLSYMRWNLSMHHNSLA